MILADETLVELRVHDQLLKLAHDLPRLVNSQSKPRAIVESAGGEQQTFRWITAAELATGKFDLTYPIGG